MNRCNSENQHIQSPKLSSVFLQKKAMGGNLNGDLLQSYTKRLRYSLN